MESHYNILHSTHYNQFLIHYKLHSAHLGGATLSAAESRDCQARPAAAGRVADGGVNILNTGVQSALTATASTYLTTTCTFTTAHTPRHALQSAICLFRSAWPPAKMDIVLDLCDRLAFDRAYESEWMPAALRGLDRSSLLRQTCSVGVVLFDALAGSTRLTVCCRYSRQMFTLVYVGIHLLYFFVAGGSYWLLCELHRAPASGISAG